MFRPRAYWDRFSKLFQVRAFSNKPIISGDKMESRSVSNYVKSYDKLDKLTMTNAAKILFSDPPKKKTFGIDFHLVQLFFACLPSLAVYLVAQYARYEMRKMDAELEEKKKREEKEKEIELYAAKGKEAGSDTEMLEVKTRLEKLEDAVKEIVVVSKKQQAENDKAGDKKKQPNSTGEDPPRLGPNLGQETENGASPVAKSIEPQDCKK